MVLCKRCKKIEAIEGKKNCVACAKYMSNYMKEMRAKKKVLDAVEVPKINIYDPVPVEIKSSMVINEDPEYDFGGHIYDSEKKTLINVNNDNVNKNKVNNVNITENKISPEHFRYFYFTITGRVFRKNNLSCINELIKILEKELN